MCRSGCPTPGEHKSWGECARAANLRVAYCQSAAGKDYTRQKKWDADLAAYDSARALGVEPAGTSRRQVEQALALSEKHGVAAKAK